MKMVCILTLSLVMTFLHAEKNYEDKFSCMDETIKTILATDASKQERQIIFSKSSDDEELLLLLKKVLSKKKNENLFVTDLDLLWDWDRENGMKFIYKLLDLMDRNYEIDSLKMELKNKYLNRAMQICKN
jgi:hypothetical protein